MTYHAAIPTIYKGAQFLSRLEARWAAFFDLAGWRWDYEPCDFDGWIPDFVLFGAHGPIYVEVKPIYLIPSKEEGDYYDQIKPFLEVEKVNRCKEVDRLVLGNGPQQMEHLFILGAMFSPSLQRQGPAFIISGNLPNTVDFSTSPKKSLRCIGPGEGKFVHPDVVRTMWLRAGSMTQWKPERGCE
jgi:hypothetical protein